MLGTCFPLPGFDIDDHSPVLLSKVLQDDHIMWFIGIIHIYTASPHTEDLNNNRERKGNSAAHRTQSVLLVPPTPSR